MCKILVSKRFQTHKLPKTKAPLLLTTAEMGHQNQDLVALEPLCVDAACPDGGGYAVDGEHVGGDAIVDPM